MLWQRSRKEKPCAKALDENRKLAKSIEDWLDFMWYTREEAEIEKNKLRFTDWWNSYRKRSWSVKR